MLLESFTPAETAGLTMVIVVPLLALLVLRTPGGASGKTCRRCSSGYRLVGLHLQAYDGRVVCVRCPSCRTFYGIETTTSRVFKLEGEYVKARWQVRTTDP